MRIQYRIWDKSLRTYSYSTCRNNNDIPDDAELCIGTFFDIALYSNDIIKMNNGYYVVRTYAVRPSLDISSQLYPLKIIINRDPTIDDSVIFKYNIDLSALRHPIASFEVIGHCKLREDLKL